MNNCVESTLLNVDPICPNMCHIHQICHFRFGDNMLWVSPCPYTKQLGRTTEKACQVVIMTLMMMILKVVVVVYLAFSV